MIFKLINGLFLAVFILAGLLQYNDPDALAWIVVYLLAASMCLAQWLGHLPRWLPGLLLVLSLGWAGSLLPQIVGTVSWGDIVASLSMDTREVEEAREIGGLLLIAIWAGALGINQRRQQSSTKT